MKNKKLKRLLCAVTIGAMTLGLVSGCSGGGSQEVKTDESGAVVIKFGIHVANPAEQETVTNNIVHYLRFSGLKVQRRQNTAQQAF